MFNTVSDKLYPISTHISMYKASVRENSHSWYTMNVETYEIMIPNVIKLPSNMMKLPRLDAGEHSAW